MRKEIVECDVCGRAIADAMEWRITVEGWAIGQRPQSQYDLCLHCYGRISALLSRRGKAGEVVE